MNIPLIAFILQGIPELIAVVTLAFVIVRIPLNWKRIVVIGSVIALISYTVRLFPIPFGVHTILQVVLLFLILTWFGKGDFSLSIIASLLSFLSLGIMEYFCLSLLMPVFGVNPEELFSNLLLRIIITEPQVLLMFAFAYMFNKFTKRRGNYNEFF
ncbi:membrane protein [Desulfosporosinus sp. HMP52]|nr:membrane protein [Desulfosporosinus sp. HMP52]